jgi:hypothetical protein
MNWATHDPASLPTLGPFQPQNSHVPSAVDPLQWPLMDIPHHTFTSITHLARVTGTTCTEELSSTIAPSLSQLANTHLGIASDSDEVIATSNLMLRPLSSDLEASRLDITASHIKSQAIAPLHTTTTVPLHQASVATWKPASAKRKGPQSRIPLVTKQILEDEFVTNPYPCSWEMDIIAHQANLDVKKVRNWFNNTRARKKGGGKYFL